MTDGSKYPDLHTAEEMECVQTNVGAPVRARDTSGFWLILEVCERINRDVSGGGWIRSPFSLTKDSRSSRVLLSGEYWIRRPLQGER